MCFAPNFRYIGKNESVHDALHNDFIGNSESLESFKLRLRRGSIPFRDDDFQMIPCGQCGECRLNYSREWAFRCVKEAEQYAFNYFVTLTYDDDHIPLKTLVNEESGEMVLSSYYNEDLKKTIVFPGFASLEPDDMSKFIKRLRTRFDREKNFQGVRFFGCGEYGDKTHRPHMHIILFNCPLDDLVVYSSNSDGMVYYTSEFLSSCWPYGKLLVTDVTYDSCAYVARYVTKKITGKGWKEIEEKFIQVDNNSIVGRGFDREFVRMSRKPGIGAEYYRLNKENIYKHDRVICKKGDNLLRSKPPRFYDKLFDLEEPGKLEHIKMKRSELAKNLHDVALVSSGLSFTTFLSMKKEHFESKFSNLRKF